ncbi:hypothetical protein NP493_1081g02030 [Ridgeia piscesae]|uniref:G-protein coupled receptors family 1 profile domain-containing protein n=1 Tax=Ridgeia piscesae TaxID=27915 RepID=A0AAD9NL89_RIDPI|nr:hypothetical protein NP493_1081g02030 [Ridgeia piscesae]
MFLVIALFFLPSCLIGFCYCRIARALWSDSLPTETSNHGNHGKSNEHSQILVRRKTAKMLIAVVAIFGICYLPVHLLNILRYARARVMFGQGAIQFALIAHWLCYFNSAINPVIYNFMSAKFRKEFQLACVCCCCCAGGRRQEGSRKRLRRGYAYSYRGAPSSAVHTEQITLSSLSNRS